MNTLNRSTLPSKDELISKFKDWTITPEEKDVLLQELTKTEISDEWTVQNKKDININHSRIKNRDPKVQKFRDQLSDTLNLLRKNWKSETAYNISENQDLLKKYWYTDIFAKKILFSEIDIQWREKHVRTHNMRPSKTIPLASHRQTFSMIAYLQTHDQTPLSNLDLMQLSNELC